MSRQIIEQVDRAFPTLLQTNIGATCFRFIQIAKDRLERAGHMVAFVAKTNRDGGQYRPPGLGQHQVRGTDGNLYTLTGVSHDVLYVDGEQRDLIISGNYYDHQIYNDDKQLVVAKPKWGDPIPRHEYRAWNPPLPPEYEKLFPPVPAPTGEPVPPRPPAAVRLPSYGELGDAKFFVDIIGRRLEADMLANGEHMNAGSADWIARSVHGMIERFMQHGDHRDAEAIAKKVQNEWRAVMNNPKLPQL